jgi:uncharacterized membrane protein YgcG
VKTTEAGGYLRVRIGDPDRTVTGEQDYRIRYRVERAILFFADHDEVYWNATGDEWPVPIDGATVRVELPPGTSPTRVACYTGPAGSTERACAISASVPVAAAVTRPLRTREGFTVAVGFPKGVVAEPSGFQKALARLRDYGVHWVLLPVLTLAALVGRWRRAGRDPKVSEAIAVRYEPPPGLSPAEIGTVFDERADLDDVTSTIVDLAIRGFLTIEELASSRLLFFSTTDTRLTRKTPPAGATPKPHERKVLDGLFAGGSSVLVSDLRDKFYRHLPGIQDALYGALGGGEALFTGRPDRVRTGWQIAGGAIVILAFFLPPAIGVVGAASAAVSGLMVLAAARAMPQRTRRGREVYEQILGFREFLTRVEADRLERLGGRTAATFERLLPVAIVLGVADRWAEAFAGVYTAPPTWYSGGFDGGTPQPRDLVRNVGRSLDTMGRAMASSPRGSGSSGSGGGGSSGGGFGGGGGGSW